MLERFETGHDGELDKTIGVAGLFAVHRYARIEVLDLGGNRDLLTSGVKETNLAHAGGAGDQRLPRTERVETQRRDGADAGHHHSIGHDVSGIENVGSKALRLSRQRKRSGWVSSIVSEAHERPAES